MTIKVLLRWGKIVVMVNTKMNGMDVFPGDSGLVSNTTICMYYISAVYNADMIQTAGYVETRQSQLLHLGCNEWSV